MLSRFSVKNFKSIGEEGVSLELKPLTILVGPNGSGKSSILQALATFCQSLRENLRHDRDLVKFSSIEDLIHKNEIHRWLNFELTLKKANLIGYRYEWRKDSSETRHTIIRDNKELMSVEYIGDPRQGWKWIAKLPDDSKINLGTRPTNAIPGEILGEWEFDKRNWPQNIFKNSNLSDKTRELDEAHEISLYIYEKLSKKIFFLSSNRGKIPFQAQASEVPEGYSWVGSEGERLIPILSLLSSPKYEESRNHIIRWSEKFGLLKLSAGVRGPGQLKAEYREPLLNATLNLALASQGSRQILSIITQLFWSPSESVVMIEEPEISLHPEKQIEIVRLFAEAIKENKQQIIISTHSHFLLLALGIVVQEGLLKKNDIAVYHVEKDKEGTKIKEAKLSKRGFLLGWPPSFDKVEKALAREWFKSFEKQDSLK